MQSVGWSRLQRQSTTARQNQLMEEDRCILVDEHDTAVGSATKRECHHRGEISRPFPLHRAFSVFLFNPETQKMLLQRRAWHKLTFPGMWSNACCSHPLVGEDLIDAMQRRLADELGIAVGRIARDEFKFAGTVQYSAVSPSDPQWGEHELDHLYVVSKDVHVEPNPEEVEEVRWMEAVEVDSALRETPERYSPWFRAVARDLLLPPVNMWGKLARGGSVPKRVNLRYPQSLV